MTRKTDRPDTYRPFEKLRDLLKERPFAVVCPSRGGGPSRRDEPIQDAAVATEDEERLFLEAMLGVDPMAKEDLVFPGGQEPVGQSHGDPDQEALARLEVLVQGGEGFVVAHTAEYMEGMGYGVDPAVAERLHGGDFSIQGHVDLHGLGVEEARAAFESFLQEAISTQKRAVLVIHGRGLSSPDEPVLKAKVKAWLNSSRWRKWIIAFTSARACDGGAGATYVLLRQRPMTKRHRKKRRGGLTKL